MIEGKLMPQARDLEEAVLGAVMIESEVITTLLDTITTEKIFYVPTHQLIWKAISTLYVQSKPIDIITVTDMVKFQNGSADAYYITSLSNKIGSAANTEYHAMILKQFYLRRKLIEVSMETAQKSYLDDEDVFLIYDMLLSQLNALNTELARFSEKGFNNVVLSTVEKMKEAGKNKSYITGVSTHLNSLDRVTMGWQKQDLIIIAGRPSMGKTAFAIDIARKQAKNGGSIGIFSLEMSENQLTERILSAETLIPLGQIRSGGLKKDEWSKLDSYVLEIQNYKLHICDKGGLSINDICSISKNWKLKHNIEAIYIDYLQLITNNGGKNGNREQEISGISRRLKQLAKELNVPVICLSQLSRSCESRQDKRPMLSDLRESGAIEQDADMVIFPFREEYYNDQAEKGRTELIIAKHRNGKTGMVDCFFNADCQKFSDSICGTSLESFEVSTIEDNPF